ncbi:MAG: YtxH domain-containing protein [Chitinophagaceae bacterium]
MNKLLTGLAIGIAIGVLIAPDKGSETRRKLSSKGKDLKDQFNDFVDSWAEKLDSLRGEAEEVVDKAATRAQPYSV